MISLPIAVVDTGAGGLSVVQAVRRLLPGEDVHYYADTANLPYGIKSPELIHRLAIAMAKKVQEISPCKVFVIACHTISVWCLKDIEQTVGLPVVGMVEPSLIGLSQLIKSGNVASIGILSTPATLRSGVYRNAWPSLDALGQVRLVEQGSGMLVSLVEEGEMSEREQVFILNHILTDAIKQVDAVLMGCTHFSALRSALAEVLKPNCQIIDAADLTALAVASVLRELPTCRNTKNIGQLIVHVSDNQERFANVAHRFLEEKLSINLFGNRHTI
ncbi:MAG TPA: glutamate racemase [Myxococcota bacterium]|nr:glutamate racemase [Myxococcota bacterium]